MADSLFRKTGRRVIHRIDRSIQQAVRDGLSWTYGSSTMQRDHLLAKPFTRLEEIHSLSTEISHGTETVMCGIETNSRLPITVGVIGIWETGQRNTLPFFQHILFGREPFQQEPTTHFPLWNLRRRASALVEQVDLLVVEANHLMMWTPDRGDWARGPSDLRMVFDYLPGESWESVEQRMKGMRRKIKKVKNCCYSYRTSHSDEDFSHFYHRYYVPMVECRFGEFGDINHEEGIRKVFQDAGELIFIQDRQGCAISGVLEYLKHGVLYSLLAGVRDGDRDLVQQGALVAMYYYSLKHGFDMGCHRHDAGVCLPYCSDGIFQHKRLWGYQPIPNAWRPHSQLVWTLNQAPSALAWMRANPFIPRYATWGGKRLSEVYANLQPDGQVCGQPIEAKLACPEGD
ncbi:MAG TPA: hypothetical protein VHO48_02845 [Anaerolineaceae bacterium]|nr:hypothetical protein [Anaerolineaceae bacterium]